MPDESDASPIARAIEDVRDSTSRLNRHLAGLIIHLDTGPSLATDNARLVRRSLDELVNAVARFATAERTRDAGAIAGRDQSGLVVLTVGMGSCVAPAEVSVDGAIGPSQPFDGPPSDASVLAVGDPRVALSLTPVPSSGESQDDGGRVAMFCDPDTAVCLADLLIEAASACQEDLEGSSPT